MTTAYSEWTKQVQDKIQWRLLPIAATNEVLKVFMYGAKKYLPGNWEKVENMDQAITYWEAAIRHLMKWQEGESIDPESGLSHLAHAGCDVLILLALELTGKTQR